MSTFRIFKQIRTENAGEQYGNIQLKCQMEKKIFPWQRNKVKWKIWFIIGNSFFFFPRRFHSKIGEIFYETLINCRYPICYLWFYYTKSSIIRFIYGLGNRSCCPGKFDRSLINSIKISSSMISDFNCNKYFNSSIEEKMTKSS